MVDFGKILQLCSGLSSDLTDVVFIGGVGVYLHALAKAKANLPPESSHDADFMISFVDYGTLKDLEELTPNPRLAKHQMIVDGVEFDVYVERLNRLVVPYDEVYAHSVEIEGIRVACLEHLLILKLEAFQDREHSTKGIKDRRDVAKIGLLLGKKFERDLALPYMRSDLEDRLRDIARSTVFVELSEKNVHTAKKLRGAFSTVVDSLLD
jgi:hypothetical protein